MQFLTVDIYPEFILYYFIYIAQDSDSPSPDLRAVLEHGLVQASLNASFKQWFSVVWY